MDGFIAQLIDHCTDDMKVMGSIPIEVSAKVVEPTVNVTNNRSSWDYSQLYDQSNETIEFHVISIFNQSGRY